MSQKPKIFMISVVLMGVSSIYVKSATLTEILAKYCVPKSEDGCSVGGQSDLQKWYLRLWGYQQILQLF